MLTKNGKQGVTQCAVDCYQCDWLLLKQCVLHCSINLFMLVFGQFEFIYYLRLDSNYNYSKRYSWQTIQLVNFSIMDQAIFMTTIHLNRPIIQTIFRFYVN